jgi:serine/threonine-protein kinase HipA
VTGSIDQRRAVPAVEPDVAPGAAGAAQAAASEALAAELDAGRRLVLLLAADTRLFERHPDVRDTLEGQLAQGRPLRVLQIKVNDELLGWLFDVNDVWLFQYHPRWSSQDNAFSLAPGLDVREPTHMDGSSQRPVQWYFDNLLPEEELLKVLAQDAQLEFTDAFGLLRHYGAESAGSLVLMPLGAVEAQLGARELTRETLNQRIVELPRAPLTRDSPKKMSLAGAQHKMVVIYQDGRLCEPLAGTPSTHILKPNSLSSHYPHSVVNEYFVLKLAAAMRLAVPPVYRLYLPEPAYLIERFDRHIFGRDPDTQLPRTARVHVIDTCQLLDSPRTLKYKAATLDTLARAIGHTRSKARARAQLFRWLVFNILVGNGDNHLKNISFTVTRQGVELAPGYDMLCTAVYDTRGFASNVVAWPRSTLGTVIPGAERFHEVTYRALLDAGLVLGLGPATARRLLDELLTRLPLHTAALLAAVDQEYDTPSADASAAVHAGAATKAGERQLLRTICHAVIRDMLDQVNASRPRT